MCYNNVAGLPLLLKRRFIFAMKAILTYENESVRTLDTTNGINLRTEGNVTIIQIPRYLFRGEKVMTVDLDPDLPTASVGDEGWMLTCGNCNVNTMLLYFREREDYISKLTQTRQCGVMPIMGERVNGNAFFAIATGMGLAFSPVITKKGNRYSMSARYILEGDEPYEDIELRIWELGNADYNDMAHIYRKWQMDTKGIRPIRERMKDKPALAYAADSIEIRIRQAWKPSPSPVAHQTPDNEPPMKIVCDFDKVSLLLDRFKAAGIEKAEICLVGWNRGGHDGRFPQLFPAEPQLGGNEKLISLLKKGKEMGYAMVCHDNYTAAYECAECWDEEYIAKFKDGRLGSHHYDNPHSGGVPYLMCPQRAYERFAVNRLPKYREFGFEGLHFVDVFSNIPPRKCYDWRHPNNLADCRDYYLKIMRLASENIGGFQSEGPYDFVAQELDYCMYTRMFGTPAERYWPAPDGGKPIKTYPNCDEAIPFWELVYHGIILSNPLSDTVNYVIKEPRRKAELMAVAGRPLMYIHSKFGEQKNWMGDNDLYCIDEADIDRTVSAIKEAYDLHETYKWLQYEFMERHERLPDGSSRVTFSDGTVITANPAEGTFEVIRGDKA